MNVDNNEKFRLVMDRVKAVAEVVAMFAVSCLFIALSAIAVYGLIMFARGYL